MRYKILIAKVSLSWFVISVKTKNVINDINTVCKKNKQAQGFPSELIPIFPKNRISSSFEQIKKIQ